MSNDIVIKRKIGQESVKPNIEFTGSSGGTAKLEVSATGNLEVSHGSSSSWTSFSNPTRHSGGISGSLTRLVDGKSYITSGAGISIVSNSLGQISISANSNIAPSDASYVTLSSNETLSNERVLTPGIGLVAQNNGSNYTLNISDSVVATISGSTFTGPVKFNSGVSGSLQSLVGGEAYLKAGTGITISTGSSPAGQITITSNITPGGSDQQVQFNNSSTFGGDSAFTFNNSTKMLSTQNVTLAGDIAVNGGDITTTAGEFNIGNTATTTQTLNLATAGTTAGQIKTVNLGAGSESGSTTNINIGSGNGGTTTVSSPNFQVNGDTTLGNANTDITTVSGDLAVNGGDITTSAAAFNIGASTATVNIGASTATQTLNLAAAATAAGSTKTVNIGTGGAAASSTAINMGSTSNSRVIVNGTFFNTGSVYLGSNTTNHVVSINAKLFASGNVVIGDSPTDELTVKSDAIFESGLVSMAGNLDVAGSVFVDEIKEKTLLAGLTIEGIRIKDRQLMTGTLTRRVHHIPENFGNQTLSLNDSMTFSPSFLSLALSSRSDILLDKLEVGDTIVFHSHVTKGTVVGTVGNSAAYTSTVHIGTSTGVTNNIVSKISFDNDDWYEASHIVNLHVLSKSASQMVVATTGIGCNLWNSEASSATPTTIPRVITLTITSATRLYFMQRGAIAAASMSGWSQSVGREVDKSILYKFNAEIP